MSRELHRFSDASETAYAEAVYLRALHSVNGTRVARDRQDEGSACKEAYNTLLGIEWSPNGCKASTSL